MKKTYQKPALDMMNMEQENMMATSSLGIYDDSMVPAMH